MAHQCVHCGKMYPAGSRALIDGCDKCKGHFFFYIRDEQMKKMEEKGIIIQYRIGVNLNKLGLELYKAVIKLDRYNKSDEKSGSIRNFKFCGGLS